MAPAQDSYDFYFQTTGNVSKCIVDATCKYFVNRGTKMSTACLISHLKNNHKNDYKKFEKAREEKKAKNDKILQSQPKLSFQRLPKSNPDNGESSQTNNNKDEEAVPSKKLRMESQGQLTVANAFSNFLLVFFL
jgi:hypothetical protein